MADLERFRDASFQSILSVAFRAHPAKVKEIQQREGWTKFSDFMAAVARSGKVLYQFQDKKPRTQAELTKAYREANTYAMRMLLSGAFFGEQEGEVDPGLAEQALEPMEIRSWDDMSKATLQTAVEVYRLESGGKSPLDVAKEESRLFHNLDSNRSQEIILKLVKAFGLSSPDHLIALAEAYWGGDVSIEDLDQAVGKPEVLTELVGRSPSNTHKGIVFPRLTPLSR